MDFQVTPDCDAVLKMIMIGNSGVGKSALLKCFMGDPFDSGYTSTIGVDFEIKPVTLDGKTVNLQIWDTAGQERFRTITTSYYRSADAILLVYDITDQLSFDNLNQWREDVKTYAREGVNVLLLGNKLDLEARRAVTYEDAQAYAEENGMSYVETSALVDRNVEDAFTRLALASLQSKAPAEEDSRLKGSKTTSVKMDKEGDPWSNSCCG